MYTTLTKMKQALYDIEELLNDVRDGRHIPIRFRKMPVKRFMDVERPRYVRYLEREVFQLKNRVNNLERLKVRNARPSKETVC